MPVKAVVLDLDGTLVDDSGAALQPGVREMLDELSGMGLELFVVSGQPADPKKERLVGLPPDRFLYAEDYGAKGQRKLVGHIFATYGLDPTEVVYMGDSEPDMWEAANSHVLLFNAEYSHGPYKYGVPIAEPGHLPLILRDFFSKEALWYYTASGTDQVGKSYDVRSLINPEKATQTGIRNLIKGWYVSDTAKANGYDLTYYLVMQLLASIFLDGLHLKRVDGKRPIFCLYPGHAGDYGDVLKLFERFAAKQLNVASLISLVQRHTPTQSSKEQRIAGKSPQFVDQINSVLLDSEFKNRIKGNIVTVVDDFCTDGNAMECSRNLLYAAGAKEVVSISVGKYGDDYNVRSPKKGVKLTPFAKHELPNGSFDIKYVSGQTDPEALKLF